MSQKRSEKDNQMVSIGMNTNKKMKKERQTENKIKKKRIQSKKKLADKELGKR